MRSDIFKQRERRRRQFQRRRERKQQQARQQDGSEPPVDDELATRIQDWALHEPRQRKPEEPGATEQVNPVQQTVNSTLESLEKDCIDSGTTKA